MADEREQQVRFHLNSGEAQVLDAVRGAQSRSAYAKAMALSPDERLSLDLSQSEADALDRLRGDQSRADYVRRALFSLPVERAPKDPDEKEHLPVAGRIALFCIETGCGRREFGDINWRCPNHPNKTAVQRNQPYLGLQVPPAAIEGLKVYDPWAKLPQ